MKKFSILLLFILFAFCSLNSQTLTVFDKSTLKPVANALVFEDIKSALKTNVMGQVDISSMKSADKITIDAIGYAPRTYSYTFIEAEKFNIYLTEKTYSTDEIVISADRFQEKLKDIPRQIGVINSRDIKFYNPQTTAELLMKTGDIMVQKSQQGAGSPILRGFESNRVLIVIDGVRLNNAIFRGGHLQNVIRIDPSIIEKTEVLYGPGSVMYGSDALGGSMNFYTKNPNFSFNNKTYFTGNVYSRYSSANNEKTGHLDFNVGLKNVSFLTSVSYSNFGDLKQGGNWEYDGWKRKYYTETINGVDIQVPTVDGRVQNPSGYSQYDIFQKILFKQSENVQHTLNFQFSNSSDVPRYDRLALLDKNKLVNSEWYYGPEKRLMGLYKLDLKAEKTFFDNSVFTLAFQDIKESRNSRSFGSSSLTSRTEKVKVYTANFDFTKRISNNEIRYGLEGTYNDVNSTAIKRNIKTGVVSPASTRYFDGGSNMKSIAGYLSHSWEINKNFVLSEGVRYSYVTLDATINDTTFYKFPFKEIKQRNSAINGQIGLVYMPGDDWRFYLGGSTGFKAPNIDDLTKIFDTQKGNVVVPNENLKPEYTYTGEFGISKVIDKNIKIEGIAYATYWKNAFTLAKFQFNGQDSIMYDGKLSGIQAPVNADKGAYILGYNLNLNADVTNYLSIISTVNFTYGRLIADPENLPMSHIPPLFGKTAFLLKFNKFKGELNLAYNGWKHIWDYNQNADSEDNLQDATPDGMPAWYTLNLNLAYQIHNNLQIQAGVENIFDKNYRVFSSGISSPGRNFIITLRGNW